MQKSVRTGNIVVPRIRTFQNTRDRTMIKLDLSNGVCTMNMWTCLDETCPVFSRRDSEWPNRFRQACTTGSSVSRRRNRKQEIRKMRIVNGVEKVDDRMSVERRDEEECESQLAPPDWRVRAGPRHRPTQKGREEHEATHVPFRGRTPTTSPDERVGIIENAHNCDGILLHDDHIRRISNMHCSEGRHASANHEGIEEPSTIERMALSSCLVIVRSRRRVARSQQPPRSETARQECAKPSNGLIEKPVMLLRGIIRTISCHLERNTQEDQTVVGGQHPIRCSER